VTLNDALMAHHVSQHLLKSARCNVRSNPGPNVLYGIGWRMERKHLVKVTS